MLLTIKESAALYVMDLVLNNLYSKLEESSSIIENIETLPSSYFKEEDTPISNKGNREDIMMVLRY